MFVPADAVIQRKLVLFNGIGCKRFVGGFEELEVNTHLKGDEAEKL